ncbi:MAG: MoaD/ThiS family protein [Phycisphaerales bacterium]|nr:MoaD/ThiS family protein [Phycisphaerales bacterium]
MARVEFTRHLHRFFPALAEHPALDVNARTVAELVERLETRFPGLAGYLVDDQRALRQHVNVFVNGRPVHDRQALSDPLESESKVHIMQALSGG